jgi:hypothetical protein
VYSLVHLLTLVSLWICIVGLSPDIVNCERTTTIYIYKHDKNNLEFLIRDTNQIMQSDFWCRYMHGSDLSKVVNTDGNHKVIHIGSS